MPKKIMTEPRRKKKPGRPRAAPGEGRPRDALLDAAASLFAAHGMAATSLAKVAAAAGLTSAMVHYYFKTKEQLIEAVVTERLGVFLSSVLEDGQGDPDDPVEFLTGVIWRLARASEQYPWMPALWVREILTVGGGLREYMGRLLPLDLLRRLAARYAAGQDAGCFPPEVEPLLVPFAAISNLLLPLVIKDLIGELMGLEALTSQRLAAHAEAMVRHGLAGSVPPSSKSAVRPKTVGGKEGKRECNGCPWPY